MFPPPASSTDDVNLPGVVAEVVTAFAAYESALVAGDIEALVGAFWDSEWAVRFGVSESQYGAGAIAAWRRAQGPTPPGRTLDHTSVVTFGRQFACVTTEFTYPSDGRRGRQSQTWVRRPEGWRIVSAHVSVI